MEEDARAYEELSGPQIESGSKFIRNLNLSLGNKVLDMGCGTGHLTKYIADIVGPNGLAVGVDPDVERIQIAEKKSKEVSNLQFYEGSSAIGFPHDNEPYYDVHISTHSFHWILYEEKIIYLQKAHQCLKRGRRLAIFCGRKIPKDEPGPDFYPLTHEGYQNLFQELGLFSNVVVENIMQALRFKSFDEFKRWSKASSHQDKGDHSEFFKKYGSTSDDDGQVIFKLPYVSITACKR